MLDGYIYFYMHRYLRSVINEDAVSILYKRFFLISDSVSNYYRNNLKRSKAKIELSPKIDIFIVHCFNYIYQNNILLMSVSLTHIDIELHQ